MKRSNKRNYQTQTQDRNQPASVLPEVVEEATPVEAVDEPAEQVVIPTEILRKREELIMEAIITDASSHQTAFLQRVNQRIGKATICPDCGASGFTVNRTKPREDGQFRQRKCKQCGAFSNELQFPPIPLDIDGNPV